MSERSDQRSHEEDVPDDDLLADLVADDESGGTAGTDLDATGGAGTGLDDDPTGLDDVGGLGTDLDTAHSSSDPTTGVASGRSEGSERTTERDGESRLRSYFSPRGFLLALAVLGLPATAGSSLVPLVGGPLGLFVGAFVLGLVGRRRRYAEAGIAGATLGALGVLIGNMTIAVLAGIGIPLVALGGIVGLALGLVGLYFGRDLRDGLTRDI